MRYLSLSRLALCCAVAALSLAAFAAPERTYEAPYAQTAPMLDGVLAPGEWDNATVIPSGGGQPRQAYGYIMWREDAIYFAQLSPLRPNEKPIKRFRDPAKSLSVHDDCCEIFICTDQVGKGRPVEFFQTIFGPADNVTWHEINQYSIGQRVSSWKPGWVTANGITPDGKAWVTECKIPVKDYYYQGDLKDGTVWKMNFVRDWKRPWEWGGTEYVATPTPKVVFRKGPAITVQLSNIESLNLGKAGAVATVRGVGRALEGIAQYVITQDNKTIVDKTVPLAGDAPATVGPFLDAQLLKGKGGDLSVTVKKADGTIVYLWRVGFTEGNLYGLEFVPDKEAFYSTMISNPMTGMSFVDADYYELEKQRVNVKKTALIIKDEKGKVVSRTDAPPAVDFHISAKLPWPKNLPIGKYTVRISLQDKAGKEIAGVDQSFSKLDPAKEFPWWGTTVGVSRKVLEPWEPVTATDTTAKVWGRNIEFGANGLFKQVTSQGTSLLAAPMTLNGKLADGTPLNFTGGVKVIDRAQDKSIHQASILSANEAVLGDVRSETEYDGCVKTTITLSPKNGQVKLTSLTLDIPFDAAIAKYIRANHGEIRRNIYTGAVPAGNGVVWDSRIVNDGHPMTVGSFAPYVWVGAETVGMCFFAGSDQGWWPSEKQAAIEIIREGGKVIMRLNLASEPVTLDGKREIVLGFMANPVKPLARNYECMNTTSFNGPVREGRIDPNEKDAATRDMQLCRPYPSLLEVSRLGIAGGRDIGTPCSPYISKTDPPAIDKKEADYFAAAWTGRAPEEGGGLTFWMRMTKEAADYHVYWYDKWMEECNISGLYVDNIYCCMTRNPDLPPAYLLPDGRTQPGFTIWEDRDLMKRLQTVLQDRGVQPRALWAHMTHSVILPILSFCDDTLQGEDRRITPGGANFMEQWSREDMITSMYSPAFGWRCHFLGAWEDPASKAWTDAGDPKAVKAMRTEIAALWPYGIRQTIFGNWDIAFDVDWKMYNFTGTPSTLPIGYYTSTPDFPIDPKDDPLQWWATQTFVTVSNPDVRATIWPKEDRIMVMLSNFGKTGGPLTVKIPLGRFWTTKQPIGGDFHYRETTVIDQESGARLDRAYNRNTNEVTITLPLNAYDFRLIQIMR